ncbi:hypothetical protein HNY73_007925 [Argiope bruennichi]|uniref:Uncharacterized protein n=1 Tax=Argiope bruennichi TaxID=94029 RepID=A0A8T0F765_ARGBR|nr:hypothetical protein HNY73_007925 [Argiope bruennichi]
MCELHFVDDFVKKAYGLTQKQRDCPEEKEQSALIQAIEDSIRENEIYVKSRSFGSLKEFRLKFLPAISEELSCKRCHINKWGNKLVADCFLDAFQLI